MLTNIEKIKIIQSRIDRHLWIIEQLQNKIKNPDIFYPLTERFTIDGMNSEISRHLEIIGILEQEIQKIKDMV